MTMRIGKRFTFEASHQLPDKPCYGKCSQLHGHRYELEVELEGSLRPEGWLMNFSDLKALVKTHVLEPYDHRHLNDGGFYVPGLNQWSNIPTVEHIAAHLFHVLQSALKRDHVRLVRLRLYETQTSWAEIQAD